MSAGVFADSFEDSSDDSSPEFESRRRRGVRRLYGATIVGGVLAVALSVGGTVWVVHDLERSPSTRTEVIAKYQKQLDSCVSSGRSTTSCSNTAIAAWIADPYWHDDAVAITTYCDLRPSSTD